MAAFSRRDCWVNKYESADFTFRGLSGGSFDTPADLGGRVSWREIPLMVDLRYPNEVLVNHFKAYLQTIRQDPRGNPPEAGKHSPDLAAWTSQGLLPCMDLILWANELGNKMPIRLFVKAVNAGPDDDPDEPGDNRGVDEEGIRKIILPLAKDLLGQTSDRSIALERLRAFAGIDMLCKYGLKSKKRNKK